MDQTRPGPSALAELSDRSFNTEQVTQILMATMRQPWEALEEPKRLIEHPYKLRVKPFDGSGDLESALAWLDRVNEIYKVIGCSNEQRVLFSSLFVEDRAKD